MRHILTIDFEDWHRLVGQRFGLRIRTQAAAIEAAADVLLGLLDRTAAKATFFVLGSLATKVPYVVRRISGCGHEVASHGYRHYPPPAADLTTLAQDTAHSIAVLSDLTGRAVAGYRSPRFALPEDLDGFFTTLAAAHLLAVQASPDRGGAGHPTPRADRRSQAIINPAT